jgi:hypothetical protein
MSCFVRGLVALLVTASSLTLGQPAAAAPVTYGGTVMRAQVMARAGDWLRRKLPYSQDNGRAQWDVNRGRRYRTDCSGFVAMAWALDPYDWGRAPVTWELPAISRKIGWGQLRGGDVLLRLVPGNRGLEHVRLVQGWADSSRTRITVVEQSASAGGMRRTTTDVATARRYYHPYRYRRIR